MAVGKALSVVGLGTGKIMGLVGGKKLVETSSKAFVKEVVKNAFEEGMEEVSTALVEPLMKSIYQGSDALEEYKDPSKFLFGIGGDFNESVAGQFAAGAFTGGLMSGVGAVSQYRATQEYFGKDGSKVAKYHEEAAVAMKNMLEYQEGSYQYKRWYEKWVEAIGKETSAWNTAKGTMTETQLDNLRDYLADPTDFINRKTGNVNNIETINKTLDRVAKEENFNELATRQVFGDIVQMANIGNYNIEFADMKDNAKVNKRTKTITINNKLAKEYGSLIGHEFGAHIILSSIGAENMQQFYNSIEKSEWYKKEKASLEEAYKTKDKTYKKLETEELKKAYYQEEVVANYFQDAIARQGGNIAQLQYVKKMFEKRTFVRKVLDFFNRIRTGGNVSVESAIADAINFVVESSNETTLKKLVKDIRAGKKWAQLTNEEKQAFTIHRHAFEMLSKSVKESAKNVVEEMASKNRSVFSYEGNKANDTYDKIIQPALVNPKELKVRGGRYIEPFAGSLTSMLNYISDGNGNGEGFDGQAVASELNPYTHALLKTLKENTPNWIINYIHKTIREYNLRTEKGFNKLLAEYNHTLPNQRLTKEMALNLWILQRFSNSSTILHFDDTNDNFAGTFNPKVAQSAFTNRKDLMSK